MYDKAIALIKEFEGCKLVPYQDSGGVWTVGFGCTTGVNADTQPITQEQADLYLQRDINTAVQRIRTYITSELSDNQLCALISLVFNLGVAPLKGTLGRLLNAGDKEGTANQFGRWIYCGGLKLDGLARRRQAEKELFLSS